MKRTLSSVITTVLVLAMVIAMMSVSASALTWDNVSETRYASRYMTSDYTTGKFYKNLTQIPLTGDGRRDVVAVAASQMGYIEGDNANGYDGVTGGSTNFTEYGCFLGLTGGSGHAWCAAFCAWSFYAAEVTDVDGSIYDTDNGGNIWADAYVPYWSEYLIEQGRYKAAYQFRNSYSSLYDASYVPQPGDLVFFYTATGDYPGWEGHIGLVAYSDGTYVYTLEGNTSSQQNVESEGGGAFFKKYDLKGSSLVGFGSMPYESVAGLPEIDYTGANPTPGLYVTPTGSVPVYLGINDSTASWTLPMSSVFEVSEISTSSNGVVMLHAKCEINGTTVTGWVRHGSDSNGYTKTLQIYASGEVEPDPNDQNNDGIPDSYLPSVNDEGEYVFDNAYGYTFNIDDVNGSIGGEDATLITSASAYESCNPNWAISVQLRPNGNDNEYSVVKVVTTPGSAANAGIELADGDVILVIHSADSKPGSYANWMSKVAAIALKEGDVLSINDAQTTATVLSAGEAVEPPATDPTDPTDPAPTEPVDVPDYGGLIPGAGQQGYADNLYYGVDISYHNVNDTSYHNYETDDDSGADYSLLDFAAMKASGCDYVIIRIGSEDSYGRFIDPHFNTMYNKCREAGLDVGLYFYSLAMTYDEAVEDAQFVLNELEKHDYYFEYPIYIDIEEEDQLALSTTELDAIAYGWCDTMVDAGYFPGIYTGYYASQTMSTQLKSDYDMWIAAYGSTTPANDSLSAECSMWQYTSTGTGDYEGIGKDDIDMNVCYKDYPAIMAAGGYNKMGETTDPEQPTDPTEPTEPDVTEPTEPDVTEPTEPDVTEPDVTEPDVDIPDYGGAIPGAGIPGTTDNLAPNLYFGCDVSFYNVNDQSYAGYTTSDDSGADYSLLDFKRMKADGCDFVILRMGSEDSTGRYVDPHFYTMYNLAREAGLDIGLYYYSYALTKAEAVADAEFVIDAIEDAGMYFEYPIYIDIEEEDQMGLSTSAKSDLCYGWCDTMIDAGYFPGIYTGFNYYDDINADVKTNYDFWIAWVSESGMTGKSDYSPETHNISNEAAMWQYSWYGYEYDGVGLDMLDVNVAYKDYPAIMKAYGYNNVEQEIKIPDSYGATIGEDGRYTFDNAYGFVFEIDDVNGTIEGEDITLVDSASAFNSCNPNWAICLQLRPTEDGKYEVVDTAALPGSAAGAGFTLEDGDKVLVVHSADSKPGTYDNWMSKVAALAVKEGDIIEISADNTTATVLKPATHEHTFVAGAYTWTEDNDVCSVTGTCDCGATADANTTEITYEVTTTGTCMTAEVGTYTAVFAESWAQDQTKTVTGEKNPDNHTGNNTTGVNAKEATCTEAGYTGDTVCECGKTVAAGEVTAIDLTNHTSDEFTYTDNEDGATHTKAHKCCGTEEDAEEAHEYVDGECVCGAVEKTTETIAVINKGGVDYEIEGNVVTVTHTAPCKVGYWDAENNKYVAITAVSNEDGSYSFTAPENVTEVLVVVKGDANLNGELTGGDASRLTAYVLGKVTLTPEEIFAADATGDGRILGSDASRITATILGKTQMEWDK
ncbi:MAG: hypothetical protein IKK72_01490 [Oscillospiraceae bacterium]|nr:hypothetical protein [Oscillospiraceae bacterium]